jgi:membrane-associated phospholipid phosphatase
MRKLRLSAALFAMLSLHSLPARAIESYETTIADVLTGIIPLGAGGLAFYKEDKQGQREWLYSTAVSLAVNTTLRVALNETSWGERPNGNKYGFPSGHTSFIVSGAAFLQERYGWKYGVPAYMASAYVGYVRVETGHHRWRDVIAAGALSWGVAKLMVTPYKGKDMEVMPVVGPDILGVNVEYRW